MKPLTTFSEKKSFNNRYHPDSVWLWYSFATAMFGFALQLYSFYTPTTTDIRIPIAQGVWITLEIVTRAVLTLLDKFTLVEASSVFFDIGFATVGFTALLEPFFEAKITDTLPEVDESITDYALAIRVVSFIYPLCASSLKVRDLYVDNFWPAPATAKAMTEKKRSLKRTIIKLVLLGLQLGAAMSVYGIMGNDELCHQFRTCARGSCTPNVPVGAPLDAELFSGGSSGGNANYRSRMISDDGTMIWRWGINSQTQMKMTKSGGKLYADLKFAPRTARRRTTSSLQGPNRVAFERIRCHGNHNPVLSVWYSLRSPVPRGEPASLLLEYDGQVRMGQVQHIGVQVCRETRLRTNDWFSLLLRRLDAVVERQRHVCRRSGSRRRRHGAKSRSWIRLRGAKVLVHTRKHNDFDQLLLGCARLPRCLYTVRSRIRRWFVDVGGIGLDADHVGHVCARLQVGHGREHHRRRRRLELEWRCWWQLPEPQHRGPVSVPSAGRHMSRSRRRRVHAKPLMPEPLHSAVRQVTAAAAASNLQELL